MRPRPLFGALRFYTALLGMLAAACGASAPAPPDAPAALAALFEREWEWELSQDPIGASSLGDTRRNDRWPDLTLGAIAARQAHLEAVRRELAAVDRDALPEADRINLDVFTYQLAMAIEGFRHRYHPTRSIATSAGRARRSPTGSAS